MLIVFEGPDCVGKTTLVKALSDFLEWPVLSPVRPSKLPHFLSQPEKDSLMTGQYRMYFDSHNDRVIDNALVDRCHLTNYAIGDVDWKQLRFCEDNIDATIPDRAVVGVFLNADKTMHVQKMREKNETEELISRRETIIQKYIEVRGMTKIPFLELKAYQNVNLQMLLVLSQYMPHLIETADFKSFFKSMY